MIGVRFFTDSVDSFHFSFIRLGNVYKMSRNKDRYESSNNRRQQIFMSQEDVAAGRKSNWTGVEITGTYHILFTCHWLYLSLKLFDIHLALSLSLVSYSPLSAPFGVFSAQAMYGMLVPLYGNSSIWQRYILTTTIYYDFPVTSAN